MLEFVRSDRGFKKGMMFMLAPGFVFSWMNDEQAVGVGERLEETWQEFGKLRGIPEVINSSESVVGFEIGRMQSPGHSISKESNRPCFEERQAALPQGGDSMGGVPNVGTVFFRKRGHEPDQGFTDCRNLVDMEVSVDVGWGMPCFLNEFIVLRGDFAKEAGFCQGASLGTPPASREGGGQHVGDVAWGALWGFNCQAEMEADIDDLVKLLQLFELPASALVEKRHAGDSAQLFRSAKLQDRLVDVRAEAKIIRADDHEPVKPKSWGDNATGEGNCEDKIGVENDKTVITKGYVK